jgi:hypothetical protein
MIMQGALISKKLILYCLCCADGILHATSPRSQKKKRVSNIKYGYVGLGREGGEGKGFMFGVGRVESDPETGPAVVKPSHHILLCNTVSSKNRMTIGPEHLCRPEVVTNDR